METIAVIFFEAHQLTFFNSLPAFRAARQPATIRAIGSSFESFIGQRLPILGLISRCIKCRNRIAGWQDYFHHLPHNVYAVKQGCLFIQLWARDDVEKRGW
jgi:hypothetical protein